MISATPEFVLMVSEKELLVDQIYSGELDTIGLIVMGVTVHNCMVQSYQRNRKVPHRHLM